MLEILEAASCDEVTGAAVDSFVRSSFCISICACGATDSVLRGTAGTFESEDAGKIMR